MGSRHGGNSVAVLGRSAPKAVELLQGTSDSQIHSHI